MTTTLQRAPITADEPFWSVDAEALARRLGSTVAGLTGAEARRRLGAYGPNALARQRRAPWLTILLAQLVNPLMLLLLGAALISLVVRSNTDAAIILAIAALSAIVGFFQEHRADRSVRRLMKLVAVHASALRDGAAVEVRIDDIVPGDVVRLTAGDLIPADAVVLEARSLYVDEAALTGETLPAAKAPGVAAADAPPAARGGALFMGTTVVSGFGAAMIVRTGGATLLGGVSSSLQRPRILTDFERGVQRFGWLLARITLLLTLAVFAVQAAAARPILEALLFAVALAVGLAPELLPAIVNVTLARGARRMAERQVIVKQLAAIENFGSMTVLCADKTRTLTEGSVRLTAALGVEGDPDDEVAADARRNAALQSGFRNPIDDALLAGDDRRAVAGWEKIDELPYDFVRKRLSVLARGPAGVRLITKGALTAVLEGCARARLRDGALAPIDAHREAILARLAELSARGLRTLGVAVRELGARDLAGSDEADMTFVGFLCFDDPPRAGIDRALAELRGLGVALKIITGDNAHVAAAVARRVGVVDPVVVTGGELREMSDAALRGRAGDVDLFAEVEPNQKARIVLALRQRGEVVGFMGDGINDAAAIHAADLGISVADAVDVAREAAAIVLLDQRLDVLIDGVREGRRTFANTLKYILITSSANFGNMVSMAAAALFLPFLPLLPKQILLNNFLSDLPATTLAGDDVDAREIAAPRRWDLGLIRRFMIVFGGLSSLFDALTFAALLWLVHADADGFRSGWFLVSILTELVVLLVMRTRGPVTRSRPSRALLIGSLVIALVAVALPYTPASGPLGLPPLRTSTLALMLGIVAGYAVASELVKRSFFRRAERRERRSSR